MKRLALAILFWCASFAIFQLVFQAEGLPFLLLSRVLAHAFFLLASTSIVLAMGFCDLPEKVYVLSTLGFLLFSWMSVEYITDDGLRLFVQGPLLLCGASSAAKLIVNRVERSWHIAVAALFALFVDCWSVFASSGVTRTMVETRPDLLKYLLLGFPIPALGVRGIMGISDFAILAILIFHSWKFEFDLKQNILVLFLALSATLILVHIIGVGLPAIPAMAIAFVGLNSRRLWRDFHSDWSAGFKYED